MGSGRPPDTFARDPVFWRMIARATLLGGLGALATVVFLGLEHLGHALLWGEHEPATAVGAGPWRAVPILLVAAVVVGLLRRRSGLDPPDPNFVDEVEHGRTEPRDALAFVGIGLASLVGGASLGPEAPVATAGAGIGTAVGERSPVRGRRGEPDATDDEHARDVADAAFAGMSGVFGGLLTFPFAVPMIALELQDPGRFDGYRRLVPGLISATVALALLYPVIGAPFIGLFATEVAPLRAWHLAAAVPLGLLGAVLGVATAVMTGVAGALLDRVRDEVLRAVVGGLLVAATGVLLPLTMFSGRDELRVVLERGTGIGVGVIVASILGKMLVTAVSLRAGFFGGPVLPLFFIGGSAGVLVTAAVESVPLVHAVSAVSAATAAALVPLPLSMLVLVILVFSTGAEGGAVAAVAVVTCHVAVHGTALLPFLGRVLTGDAGIDGDDDPPAAPSTP